MAYTLTDLLRRWTTPVAQKRPTFLSDDEAYEFCRQAYEKSGGVSADLRQAYRFYVQNFDAGRSRDEMSSPRISLA